jgi:hypothetical protein
MLLLQNRRRGIGAFRVSTLYIGNGRQNTTRYLDIVSSEQSTLRGCHRARDDVAGEAAIRGLGQPDVTHAPLPIRDMSLNSQIVSPAKECSFSGCG